jgi:hypothetical protein
VLHEVDHPDAIHEHGVDKGAAEGWIEFTRRRHETIGYSSHQVGNTAIDAWQAERPKQEARLENSSRAFCLISY